MCVCVCARALTQVCACVWYSITLSVLIILLLSTSLYLLFLTPLLHMRVEERKESGPVLCPWHSCSSPLKALWRGKCLNAECSLMGSWRNFLQYHGCPFLVIYWEGWCLILLMSFDSTLVPASDEIPPVIFCCCLLSPAGRPLEEGLLETNLI